MTTFDFKSVGTTEAKSIKNVVTGSERAIGVKTPLQRDVRSRGLFTMNTTLKDQIRDNLKNLILTNHGERLMLNDFGANVRELAAEFAASTTFEEEVMTRIKAAVSKFMPFVALKSFEPSVDRFNNTHVGKIDFKITYDVPIADVIDDAIVISVRVM